MNKMNIVFPSCLLGAATLLFLAFLSGCGRYPTEIRYENNSRTYSTSPAGVKSTVGMHENVTAYYILRNGTSSEKVPVRLAQGGQPSENITTGGTQPAELSMVLEVSDVFFDFDKYVIKEPFMPELDQWADYFHKNPQANAEIYGHTDSIGTVTYNQKLSENRAQAVVDYLVGKGVDRGRLTAKGFGETQPTAPNDTKQGRQKNRRVELKL